MLERIHRIKGIGLLHDADGRAFGLKKASLIYADNGRGKSTLASIFRSCSINNPDLILNRRTIDGQNEPEVSFQFSNGQRSSFQNGSWDNTNPELLVFDADFVEQNVYAGGQVTADQRRNLLNFALGESAVVAQREYDQADENTKAAAYDVRHLIVQLSLIHRELTLSKFQQITEVPDADAQIFYLNEKIVEAQKIGAIQSKELPELLDLPTFDIDPIFRILTTSLSNIDLAAEQQVKAHLNAHNKPGLEKWVSDGHSFGEEESCLFCNQSLSGLQLVQAYRSYFNHDYNQLKSSVSQLEGLISRLCSDTIIDRLKASFSTACAVINGWQEHIEILPLIFDEPAIKLSLGKIKEELEGLKKNKEEQLLDSIGSEETKNKLLERWQEILCAIDNSNKSINAANQRIVAYKENLAALNIQTLQEQIKDLEWSKARYEPDVINLFTQLSQARNREATAKAEKKAKKDALNQIMQSTLVSYRDKINELLRSFGAQFVIPNIDFNYRGGLRSDYVLQMRGSNIALSGGTPDFKTSLSEGDKRTLAFAFFIASAESDPSLSSKIIVIDDPMCSLDLNRKQQTRTVLKRIHDTCEQLIVLAHDIHFLRNIQDDVLRTSQPNDVKTIKLKSVTNRYSDIDDINIEQECESAYFKCHRILKEFQAGMSPNSMEVAKSIRPMLEGYLHRRFPKIINSGLLFGDVVKLINNAQPPSPLIHAQNITAELNEINRYAGQFHHDTDPSAEQVQVVEGELLSFVERAISVIHSGSA